MHRVLNVNGDIGCFQFDVEIDTFTINNVQLRQGGYWVFLPSDDNGDWLPRRYCYMLLLHGIGPPLVQNITSPEL